MLMRLLSGFAITLALSAAACAEVRTVDLNELKLTSTQRQATTLVTKLLSRHHYKKMALDDRFSAALLKRYLEALDPNRSYFLRSDVKTFEIYRYKLDDMLHRARVEPAFEIFKRFRTQVDTRTKYAISLLAHPFNFTREEVFAFDRIEAPWAADEKALDEVWRLRVKNDILSQRLAGKKPDEIRELLTKRYERLALRVQQLNANDVFQIFMSAYGRTIEPHTTYLSPRSSENFQIRMRLSLTGIGAALSTENEYTVVRHIIPGGPADLDKTLKVDDRIVGVGQEDGEIRDVVSWRLEDVVQLIRGEKGTAVRLAILPKSAGPGGKRHRLRLVRDKVNLDEQAAKLDILDEIPGAPGKRVGVIELPTFYLDSGGRSRGERNYRSASRDIRRLLEQLKEEPVDGIVIDLRGNSGGSLDEATDVTGLFIDTGPVVQMRYSDGRIQVKKDNDRGVAYSGPLIVLVDRFSASASEIFAGAIQDYRRGLIVGEPTFGKGTVQHFVPLDNYAERGQEGLGSLKLTVAQYFRVNGESTQHRGVIPDILFPTALGAESVGERALDNALEWSKTAPASFAPANYKPSLVDDLKVRHEDRVNADPHFQYLVEEAKVQQESGERKSLSLVQQFRENEQANREATALARENKLRVHKGLTPRDPDEERDREVMEKEEKILGDAVLREAAQILLDILSLPNGNSEGGSIVLAPG